MLIGRLSRSSRLSFRRSSPFQYQSLSSPHEKSKKSLEGKYSHTVHLPKNILDQRANAKFREPEIQQFWLKNQIFEKVSRENAGEMFVLHDGPPYANGDLHMGHALNKILKDFVNKYQLLKGRKVKFIPGWDCHGLPIELKVLQSLKKDEINKLSPIELRKKAEAFVHETVDRQRNAFKRYGVWGDWDTPYLTLQKEYEAAQISVFGSMVQKGLIYRGKKPVHWSPSSRTALAEAELEYPENHISRSVYVGFDIVQPSLALQQVLTASSISSNSVRVAVWTTTPWTLPANQAVAVRGDIEYSIISNPMLQNNSVQYIVATDLVETFIQTVLPKSETTPLPETQTHGKVTGNDLSGTTYQHPLYTATESNKPHRIHEVLLGGDYITTDSGTGLVHTAPGHGAEDYLIGLSKGLPLLSPVDDNGNFTHEAGDHLKGKFVLTEGNTAVIESLTASGHLLHEHSYRHKYPYDWRTKKPTIFRATEQWFASVDKKEYREEVLKAIDSVQWIPEIGKNRIISTVISRKDWCISRQRVWGVPIPVFYHKDTKEPLITQESIQHIEQIFRIHGSNSWWELSIAELLPPSLQTQANDFIRGADSMDVWFDSGTSWAGVLDSNSLLKYPADLYLEGSDQHRGWFQSSLLTSVATNSVAPYKAVLTHGFVLDEKGMKMSKSLGNVVDPDLIINGGSNPKLNPAYGADTLRLWVAGVDYSNDVSVGPNILKGVSDSYRKLRNTLRFILGSLDDFNPEATSGSSSGSVSVSSDVVPYDSLSSLDRHMLGRLTSLFHQVDEAYTSYHFYRVIQLLTLFSNKSLSNFYLDISKDRLYISSSSELRRKSCQTVLYHTLHQLILMLSPILPHLAEDVWLHRPYPLPTSVSPGRATSIFQQGWLENVKQFPSYENKKWELISKLKDDVNYCLELARRDDKYIGASQECHVKIYLPRERTGTGETQEGTGTEEGQVTEDDRKQLIEILLQHQHRHQQRDQRCVQGDKGPEREIEREEMEDLKYILIVSDILLVPYSSSPFSSSSLKYSVDTSKSFTGLTLEVEKCNGHKCERCWFYCDSVGKGEIGDLCSRCERIVTQSSAVSQSPPPAV
jgi:isoleucyl-tRNA synthetase